MSSLRQRPARVAVVQQVIMAHGEKKAALTAIGSFDHSYIATAGKRRGAWYTPGTSSGGGRVASARSLPKVHKCHHMSEFPLKFQTNGEISVKISTNELNSGRAYREAQIHHINIVAETRVVRE